MPHIVVDPFLQIPRRSGRIGAVRSSACTWLFSSTQSTSDATAAGLTSSMSC
jgi:hypothetical protein